MRNDPPGADPVFEHRSHLRPQANGQGRPAMSASTTGIIPAAFEYMGMPISTPAGTDHQASRPVIEASRFEGT